MIKLLAAERGRSRGVLVELSVDVFHVNCASSGISRPTPTTCEAGRPSSIPTARQPFKSQKSWKSWIHTSTHHKQCPGRRTRQEETGAASGSKSSPEDRSFGSNMEEAARPAILLKRRSTCQVHIAARSWTCSSGVRLFTAWTLLYTIPAMSSNEAGSSYQHDSGSGSSCQTCLRLIHTRDRHGAGGTTISGRRPARISSSQTS